MGESGYYWIARGMYYYPKVNAQDTGVKSAKVKLSRNKIRTCPK